MVHLQWPNLKFISKLWQRDSIFYGEYFVARSHTPLIFPGKSTACVFAWLCMYYECKYFSLFIICYAFLSTHLNSFLFADIFPILFPHTFLLNEILVMKCLGYPYEAPSIAPRLERLHKRDCSDCAYENNLIWKVYKGEILCIRQTFQSGIVPYVKNHAQQEYLFQMKCTTCIFHVALPQQFKKISATFMHQPDKKYHILTKSYNSYSSTKLSWVNKMGFIKS